MRVSTLALVCLCTAVAPPPATASPITYSYSDYNSSPGYRGWTYWDSLGQQMVWDATNLRWTCLNPLDAWCFWGASSVHPGADRSILRRWTATAAGSARIAGSLNKQSNACGGNLVSTGKPSVQSSCNGPTECWGGVPSRCNDGNTNGYWTGGSVCHTNYDAQAWYQIDLQQNYLVNRIDIYNRADNTNGEADRVTNFNVMTATSSTGPWTSVNIPGKCGYPTSVPFGLGITARYVKVQLVGTNYLNLAEVQVFADGPDGVRATTEYHGQQSNYYYTGPKSAPALDTSTVLAEMPCSDNGPHSFDYDQEIYAGDTVTFKIDRRGNYSWDATTIMPTITFEPADAIGSLANSSTSGTSATVAFDGVLQCSTCYYTDTLPPDSYTIQPFGSAGSQPQAVTLNNYAACDPAASYCSTPSPHFSQTWTGLQPNSTYKFKVRAWRGGHLYGRTRTIALTTGKATPPALLPAVGTAANVEYNATDAVISWQAPPSPLNGPTMLERFELYRQMVGSSSPLDLTSTGTIVTGEQVCANQSLWPGQYTCLSTTAPGGSCSTGVGVGDVTCALWDPPVMIGYAKWDASNNQVWVNTAEQTSPTRRTDPSTALIASVTDPGIDRKPTTYRYFLVARYNATSVAPTEKSEATGKIVLPRAQTIAGFADDHVHQFGNFAHGGTVLDGRPGDSDDGSPTYDGAFPNLGGFYANATGIALRGCGALGSGGDGNHDYGEAIDNLRFVFAGGHESSGIQNLPHWINHDNSMHQQAYKTWLKRAVDGGLRLMVMHAVNSEFVCKAFTAIRGGYSPINCYDSPSLEMQIDAAYRLQSEIDLEYCPNSPIPTVGLPDTHLTNEAPDSECGWYRIVTTPANARKVMNRGKLAVILGIEADTPFGCDIGANGPWGGGDPSFWPNVSVPARPTCNVGGGSASGVVDLLDPQNHMSLRYFYDKGVRHVFPVHGINNGFGSTALSKPSAEYALAEAALHGTFFRTGACDDRGSGLDGPLNYRLEPLLTTSVKLPWNLGTLTINSILGIPLAPSGWPGGSGPTCNIGGSFGSTDPQTIGLTPLGRQVIREMMKRRMIIDVDHMSALAHEDAVAESVKSFNYPLVSGHTNLQRLSTGSSNAPGNNEFALSTPELEEVRRSGGQVHLAAEADSDVGDVTPHVRLTSGNVVARQFFPRGSVTHDCNRSDKVWAQQYLAAVDLTRNAPPPDDNSLPPVYGVGFGSDFNTGSAMLQPRFGPPGNAYGCGVANTVMNPQQMAQLMADTVNGAGKKVRYDVDMITGAATARGYGGIDTSLWPPDPANNFPGFKGPNNSRLRRSRLNEGGWLFTLYGPDKPVSGAPGGEVPTMCLDAGNYWVGGSPLIGGCGNTVKPSQQWYYDGPSQRIRPVTAPSPMSLAVQLAGGSVVPVSPGSSDYFVVLANADLSQPPSAAEQWIEWASGQLYNALSGLCLSVQSAGYSEGNMVVMSACGGGTTGRPARVDQLWARGGEEVSFNYEGLVHIGMYPDMIQDLKNLGLTNQDLIPLFQSAEGYLESWERTGWTRPVDYTRLSSDGTWKYTAVSPSYDWTGTTFDDTTWRNVSDDSTTLAAYGASPWGLSVGGFPNPTPARWMPIADGSAVYYFRKTFVTDSVGTPKTVTVACDDSAVVYLDGRAMLTTNGWSTSGSFTFTPSVFGTHVLAVQATNTGGPGGLLVDVR